MSSGFVTEAEAAEARQKRQEEWERVRKPSDPIERPEDPYDHRSLYERLQEQKQKKDLEYEEAHKLKNMIKGLDDDEIEFLDLVDRTKLAADRKKEIEEEMELNDYRNRVATLQEKTLEERLLAEVAVNKPKITKVSSQQKLLKGIVVKKNDSQKRKSGNTETDKKSKQQKTDAIVNTTSNDNGEDKKETVANSELTEFAKEQVHIEVPSSGLKCIGILPGLGCYTESTSDEDSSESEAEATNINHDMLGRKVINKSKEKNV